MRPPVRWRGLAPLSALCGALLPAIATAAPASFWSPVPDRPAPRSLNYPETPGVLYLAMEGATLRPFCGAAQGVNAARDCTPIVPAETAFPAYAGPAERAALLSALRELFTPYDLVVADDRPPDYLPYTMAVIGGATSLVGGAAGVCGLAQVSCDGAKRNHVSLTFAESCPDKVAIIAAQESAHNWGLEHVTDPTDVMYPYAVADAPAYVDRCVEVSNQTGSPLTQCTSSHALYCPEGQGEAQNGHAELLGVFGPRTQDLEAPVIVETTPRNGDTWTTDDVFVVTATVADDSDFVGVRWSWTEGLPAELGASLTRCTNQVCDLEYPAWKPIDTPYDFVELNHPPAGSYRITLEVIDARGHWVGKEIAFTVVEGDGAPSNTGMPGDDGGDLETGPGWTTDEGVAFADDAADEDDCACQARGRGDPLWLALLLALGPRSRRRRGSSIDAI